MRLPSFLGAASLLLLCGIVFLWSSERNSVQALPVSVALEKEAPGLAASAHQLDEDNENCLLPYCGLGDDGLEHVDTRVLNFEFVSARDLEKWESLSTAEEADLKDAAAYLADNCPYNRNAMMLPRVLLQALEAVDFEELHTAAIKDAPSGLSAEEAGLLRSYADDQLARAVSLRSMLEAHVALLDGMGAPDLPRKDGYLASTSPISGAHFPAWKSLAQEADVVAVTASNLTQVQGLVDAMDQETKDSIQHSVDLLRPHVDMDWDFRGHLLIDRDLLIVMDRDAEKMELLRLSGGSSEPSEGQAELRVVIGQLTALIDGFVELSC